SAFELRPKFHRLVCNITMLLRPNSLATGSQAATPIPAKKNTLAHAELVPSTSSKINIWSIAAALICFALLWLEVINHLKAEWSLNPQYAYGWTVPFVALYLIWRRWSNRPVAAPPESRGWPIMLVVVCAVM